jgi:hypothetical protein
VTQFEVSPENFWRMTPMEHGWLYPEEQPDKGEGAMNVYWVEEMARRFDTATPGKKS